MDMQRLIHGICYFDSIAAYFTNSMLIYMIINHSPERLVPGAYKYLMLSFSSCMLIFPTCHGLLMPHLFINGKSYVFFSEGFLSRWPCAAHAGIVCWGFLFGVNNTLGEEVLYAPEVFAAVWTMALYWIGFIAIGYCTYGIRYQLQRAKLSANTKRMHRELYKALLIQASVPILADYIPCAEAGPKPMV
ncbi:unnamed protein product, partial [Mesorhabditis spiculigera]